MNTKKTLYLCLGFTIIIGLCSYVFFIFYSPAKIDVSKTAKEITTSAQVLVNEFMLDEKQANQKYVDKIIELEGKLKEVTFTNNKTTLILYSNHKDSYVICELEKNQLKNNKKLMPNQKTKIKGICKGFLKDVIFLNCILTNTQDNE